MKTRTIRVEGSKIKLEQRTCACGCGNKFWVMPKSTVRFANEYCANKDISFHWMDVHKRRGNKNEGVTP